MLVLKMQTSSNLIDLVKTKENKNFVFMHKLIMGNTMQTQKTVPRHIEACRECKNFCQLATFAHPRTFHSILDSPPSITSQ